MRLIDHFYQGYSKRSYDLLIVILSAHVQIIAQFRLRTLLKLDSNLSKAKRRIFVINFGKGFWKEFCDFSKKYPCLTRFGVFNFVAVVFLNKYWINCPV